MIQNLINISAKKGDSPGLGKILENGEKDSGNGKKNLFRHLFESLQKPGEETGVSGWPASEPKNPMENKAGIIKPKGDKTGNIKNISRDIRDGFSFKATEYGPGQPKSVSFEMGAGMMKESLPGEMKTGGEKELVYPTQDNQQALLEVEKTNIQGNDGIENNADSEKPVEPAAKVEKPVSPEESRELSQPQNNSNSDNGLPEKTTDGTASWMQAETDKAGQANNTKPAENKTGERPPIPKSNEQGSYHVNGKSKSWQQGQEQPLQGLPASMNEQAASGGKPSVDGMKVEGSMPADKIMADVQAKPAETDKPTGVHTKTVARDVSPPANVTAPAEATEKMSAGSAGLRGVNQAMSTVFADNEIQGQKPRFSNKFQIAETSNRIQTEQVSFDENRQGERPQLTKTAEPGILFRHQAFTGHVPALGKPDIQYVTEEQTVKAHSQGPEKSLRNEELIKGASQKSEIWVKHPAKNKLESRDTRNQDKRPRLDMAKFSARAEVNGRIPVLESSKQNFAANNKEPQKWQWAVNMQASDSEKSEDQVTWNNFTPEYTGVKNVDPSEQKTQGITNLASITVSNISIKRNILPGLTQVALSTGAGQNSPENWNKHNFILEDGSKIQFSAREHDGVLQLRVGSATPELNKLLQLHHQEIREHLEKECKLQIDLQFDSPQDESGFAFTDGNKQAGKPGMRQNVNNKAQAPPAENTGSQPERKIRSFGYNQMEWTA